MNIFFVICIVCLVLQVSTEPFSQRRRRTKELDDKINKIDDGTKQRIFAMKAAGMPHDAIAEKISYQAGGKTTAKRIVDAMLEDPKVRKPNTNKAPAGKKVGKRNVNNAGQYRKK
jgi:uncharacterized membrane protein